MSDESGAGARHQQLIDQAVQDRKTTTREGRPISVLTHGVVIREATTHVDARGSVCEILDPRWNWHPDPIVFSYMFSIRPGFVKGWNLHKEHEDRYFVVSGELELVLYDTRPDSPTCGQICKLILSENNRRIVNVPRNVWHADHNIGSKDVVAVNFPTIMYDHDNPDKYRLPIDTPLIPYSFPDAKGW